MEYNGYYDDDGNKVNIDLFPKPSLCLSCKKNDDPHEEILCNLTRLDHYLDPPEDGQLICHAYEPIGAGDK